MPRWWRIGSPRPILSWIRCAGAVVPARIPAWRAVPAVESGGWRWLGVRPETDRELACSVPEVRAKRRFPAHAIPVPVWEIDPRWGHFRHPNLDIPFRRTVAPGSRRAPVRCAGHPSVPVPGGAGACRGYGSGGRSDRAVQDHARVPAPPAAGLDRNSAWRCRPVWVPGQSAPAPPTAIRARPPVAVRIPPG